MESVYHNIKRPNTGLLSPIKRKQKAISINRKSKERDTFVLTPIKIHKELSLSPYNKKLNRSQNTSNTTSQIIKQDFTEILYSWSTKPTELKFRIIRPCIIIKPSICDNFSLFGLSDGNTKELVSLISAHFIDIIEKQPKIWATPRHSLNLAYQQTITELTFQYKILVPHEFIAILINKHKIFSLNIGNTGLLIGRKTIKGWEASKLIKKNFFEKKLNKSEKIIIIGNSILFSCFDKEELINIASKHWDTKNPNMASWEITEKTKTEEHPICLVLFVINSIKS